MKREITAAEKLRRIVTWLDYQNENFNDKMTSIQMIEDVYDACDRHSLEFADDLNWESEDDEEYKLAKEVNEILGCTYYRLCEPDYEYDIPEWAICYMVNGVSDDLTEDEIAMVDKFVEEHFPKGYAIEVDWDDYNELNVLPAFGERNYNALTSKGEPGYYACKTYKCSFYHTKGV